MQATKLAVLPVVFFRRQSWKPAPELVAATDPVPETFPKSPDSAAEAASKTASQPSLDLTKTVSTIHLSKLAVSPAVLHGILSFCPF